MTPCCVTPDGFPDDPDEDPPEYPGSMYNDQIMVSGESDITYAPEFPPPVLTFVATFVPTFVQTIVFVPPRGIHGSLSA